MFPPPSIFKLPTTQLQIPKSANSGVNTPEPNSSSSFSQLSSRGTKPAGEDSYTYDKKGCPVGLVRLPKQPGVLERVVRTLSGGSSSSKSTSPSTGHLPLSGSPSNRFEGNFPSSKSKDLVNSFGSDILSRQENGVPTTPADNHLLDDQTSGIGGIHSEAKSQTKDDKYFLLTQIVQQILNLPQEDKKSLIKTIVDCQQRRGHEKSLNFSGNLPKELINIVITFLTSRRKVGGTELAQNDGAYDLLVILCISIAAEKSRDDTAEKSRDDTKDVMYQYVNETIRDIYTSGGGTSSETLPKEFCPEKFCESENVFFDRGFNKLAIRLIGSSYKNSFLLLDVPNGFASRLPASDLHAFPQELIEELSKCSNGDAKIFYTIELLVKSGNQKGLKDLFSNTSPEALARILDNVDKDTSNRIKGEIFLCILGLDELPETCDRLEDVVLNALETNKNLSIPERVFCINFCLNSTHGSRKESFLASLTPTDFYSLQQSFFPEDTKRVSDHIADYANPELTTIADIGFGTIIVDTRRIVLKVKGKVIKVDELFKDKGKFGNDLSEFKKLKKLFDSADQSGQFRSLDFTYFQKCRRSLEYIEKALDKISEEDLRDDTFPLVKLIEKKILESALEVPDETLKIEILACFMEGAQHLRSFLLWKGQGEFTALIETLDNVGAKVEVKENTLTIKFVTHFTNYKDTNNVLIRTFITHERPGYFDKSKGLDVLKIPLLVESEYSIEKITVDDFIGELLCAIESAVTQNKVTDRSEGSPKAKPRYQTSVTARVLAFEEAKQVYQGYLNFNMAQQILGDEDYDPRAWSESVPLATEET